MIVLEDERGSVVEATPQPRAPCLVSASLPHYSIALEMEIDPSDASGVKGPSASLTTYHIAGAT